MLGAPSFPLLNAVEGPASCNRGKGGIAQLFILTVNTRTETALELCRG
jgi:hypothetical protein